MRFVAPVITAVMVCTSVFGSIGYAKNEDPGPSSYELKFVLDPGKVLDSENHLNSEYMKKFNFSPDEYSTNEVMYLETLNRDFINNNWINRLRQEGNKSTIERTYKKRYPLQGDKTLKTVQDAMRKAEDDGFEFSSEKKLKKTEVDWGYESMAFSISMEEDAVDPSPYPAKLAQYTSQQATAFAAEKMPQQEVNCSSPGWGLDTIKKAGMVGPVRYQKYDNGKAEDTKEDYDPEDEDTDREKEDRKAVIKEKIKVEIWPVPNNLTGKEEKYVVELSFKVKAKNKAASKVFETAEHEKELLGEYLDKEGILIKKDSLKTTATLDAFPPVFTQEMKDTPEAKDTPENSQQPVSGIAGTGYTGLYNNYHTGSSDSDDDDDDEDPDYDDEKYAFEYEDRITSSSEAALDKLSFGKLKPSSKANRKSVKIKWKKVKGAKKYAVYAKKAGKKNRFKKLKTVKGRSFTHKKPGKGKQYKYIILALKDDEVVAASKIITASTLE